MKCAKCGREMVREEKDTSSGRDMRTYFCAHCEVRVERWTTGWHSGKCSQTHARRTSRRTVELHRSTCLPLADLDEGEQAGER
jgi:hypothetical protein